MFEHLKLSDIPKRECAILRKSSSTRPVLRVIEENGQRAVVKDFSLNGWIFRNIVGRFLVWREKRAYERLKGIKGIPVFYRAVDGLAIVMEEIQGKGIKAVQKTTGISEEFYSNLYSLIGAIHDAGLAHCDLKRSPNIIVGNDGRPYIIDWSASISISEFRLFPLSLIFKRFLKDDLNAITKLKLKYSPEMVAQDEKERYMKRGYLERMIRRIRDEARRLLQRIA